MPEQSFEIYDRKVLIKIKGHICETADELFSSDLFRSVLNHCISQLQRHDSYLLSVFQSKTIREEDVDQLIQTFIFLSKMKSALVPNIVKSAAVFLKDEALLNEFVEYLYNFWRSYDRFLVCESEENRLDKRPYRVFNNTIEQLTHLIRAVYRDIQENITGSHPKIYRQIRAGAEIAAITVRTTYRFSQKEYRKLNEIPFIRQMLIYPPLILNPSMNKRKGVFERTPKNPLAGISLEKNDWLCYPAKVGALVIFIYFHKKFYELGFSLCNLFEMADDREIKRKPDAVYCFGVPGDSGRPEKNPTVFYEDEKNDLLVATVPNDDEFGYFGYLKKMALTLHNICMMKLGALPFHGALVHVMLPEGINATVLLIGDTGAGKSETLEALRDFGKDEIRDMIVIADDMGSVRIDKADGILGYGTETGAFLRLDDLKPGYAFGQIDRAIIMSPNKVNARIILPVTTFDRVISGYPVDCILYVNNYEEVDADHPVIEKITDVDSALRIFREGTVMSKGTTSATGLVHSYFANVFGPTQYRELHDKLARKYFKKFFERKIFMGQMRTRLGIPGYERKGPEASARELLNLIVNGL
ncbi:MAG: phosphoenolpyruvate carboxykinase [Candidatus Omnitrophota bacterium]